MNINGKTIIYGVIGNPIAHTLSPLLHNALALRLGVNMAYLPFPVKRENLGIAARGLTAIGAGGFNVTIPYKSEIIPFLDEVKGDAVYINSVNTVKVSGECLKGYSTDGEGFLRACLYESEIDFSGKTVAILGAGGTSRAIAHALALRGAKELYILNRTLRNALNLAADVNNRLIASGLSPIVYPVPITGHEQDKESYDLKNFSSKEELITNSDIIINTTSVGMYPKNEQSPLDCSYVLKKGQFVYDCIYNPPVTRFLSDAEKAGCTTANGLGMLLWQGIMAFEIWTGLTVPVKLVTEVKELLKSSFLKV